ncbi:helix-turn-helix domain-containing protein [Lentzea sp. HUAS TT2]|uniref:helix-turn-helix domain-containing protein n=1 Tax=Lentzea sp. HUAS TT2 TaxID=3447454 RepID=UPI003F719A90
MTAQKQRVGYAWHLREIMAQHSMFQTIDLVDPLAEHGITLSVSQVHRLVTGTPERLSLPVLSALCAIFGVVPSDLITTEAFPVGVRSTATGDLPGSAELGAVRPKRARILDSQ